MSSSYRSPLCNIENIFRNTLDSLWLTQFAWLRCKMTCVLMRAEQKVLEALLSSKSLPPELQSLEVECLFLFSFLTVRCSVCQSSRFHLSFALVAGHICNRRKTHTLLEADWNCGPEALQGWWFDRWVFRGQNTFLTGGLKIKNTSHTLTYSLQRLLLVFPLITKWPHFDSVYECPFIHIQEA